MTDKNKTGKFRAVVVGGGLSGLAAAYLLQEEAKDAGINLEMTLLEGEPRLGGKIGTLDESGFRCEIGPNGFLDNKPYTLDMCLRMGIEDRLLKSNDSARKRYIYSDGRLHQLPEDPISFMLSELISIRGKIRIATEYIVPQKKKEGADETLAEFVRRRLGQEALDKLIDPMASGIFAGDPENMSLSACFPKIVALEEGYGGLIKGMLALKKQAAAAGQQGPGSAGPGGVLMSFKNGLEDLIGALEGKIEGTVKKGMRAASLARKEEDKASFYELATEEGGEKGAIRADLVVLAVPAYDARDLLLGLDGGIASTMETIPYSAMAVVHLGFKESDLPRPLDGFGFLIPHREKSRILGSLWASSIFGGRAPEGHVLMTQMIGGAKDPKTPRLSEDKLLSVTLEELGKTMGLTKEPVFTRILKWECAIPQYTFGHPDRVSSLERRLVDHPGLFLTGNAFRGVGVNDCVSSGMKVAADAVGYLRRIGA